MEKEFVPHDIALALKNLGFNKPCIAVYNGDKLFYGEFKHDHEYYQEHGQILYQQAFRWFEGKYSLHGWVFCYDSLEYEFVIYKDNKLQGSGSRFKMREEAELACLKKMIEIIQPK